MVSGQDEQQMMPNGKSHHVIAMTTYMTDG